MPPQPSSPFCLQCGHEMDRLTKRGLLWSSWRCPDCSQQMTTRPIAGAEANARFFHVVKVWR